MPIIALKLVPTVNAEYTPALNEAGIASANLIRFKAGLPEKLGGWQKFYPYAMTGTPRDMHAWEDLNSTPHLAVGTVGSGTTLNVITNGSTAQNITPLSFLSNFTANFSTGLNSTIVTVNDPNISNVTTYDAVFFNTPVSVGGLLLQGQFPIASVTGTTTYTIEFSSAASSTATSTGSIPVFTTSLSNTAVSVALPAHGQVPGDRFTFPIPTTMSGITIDGTYPVNTTPSSSVFTITASAQATATATTSMNSGRAQLLYSIAVGPQEIGAGYGLGGYGLGGYGTGVLQPTQNGSSITASDWTLDNWGETLLACPKGGGIYQWTPTGGFLNAGLITAAPPFNNGIFVSMPAQILVAYGSTASDNLQQDPMIVRWSDQEDYENWTVSSTTQAGSFRIPRGSLIVGGLQAPQQSLLWTDLGLWAMVYQGPPYVFGFNELMSGCGLIGPHAVAVMRGAVFWMSPGNFFVFGGGGAQAIPCTVWDAVFQDLDTDNQSKCVAAANSNFNEITFFYPSLSGGTGEIDSYAQLNIESRAWTYGTLARTAWIDQSVLGEPIGATPQGLVMQHETSPDADGQPLQATFTTGWFTIAEGQKLTFLDWFFPDMKWKYFNGSSSASVQVLIEAANYPNETPRSYGPFTMTDAKDYVNCRLRGRLVRMTFSSSDVGTWWRLGNMRFRAAEDGRR